jgi:hypothetical protein
MFQKTNRWTALGVLEPRQSTPNAATIGLF